ncbi:MAG: RsmE family RNA methyltransferase [Planctomycetota bacterium]
MTRRYFAPDLPSIGDSLGLSAEESQHATRVMRLEVGDRLTLFDGLGSESEAEVIQVARNLCEVRIESKATVDREPACTIHLAIALPKPDRSRELIERLTELGVHRVTPLVAERTQRPPSESLLDKLRRGVVEACKQCGRNQLLQVTDPIPSSDFLQTPCDTVKWIADPQGDQPLVLKAESPSDVVVAIGPEGGWTPQERELAAANGFESVGLGKRIYRIETAATVFAAVLASSG